VFNLKKRPQIPVFYGLISLKYRYLSMRKYLCLVFIIPFLSGCKSAPPVPQPAVEIPAVEIKEPNFQILSIAVIQADLVNTEFEALMKIDNPNNFPVELSSIKYELYGNGMFWADGREVNVFRVPANSSCETMFHFSMNFINMNRKILDEVIKLQNVQYRFKGDAEVKAVVLNTPSFPVVFDCSGLSEVKQKSNRS